MRYHCDFCQEIYLSHDKNAINYINDTINKTLEIGTINNSLQNQQDSQELTLNSNYGGLLQPSPVRVSYFSVSCVHASISCAWSLRHYTNTELFHMQDQHVELLPGKLHLLWVKLPNVTKY